MIAYLLPIVVLWVIGVALFIAIALGSAAHDADERAARARRRSHR